MRRILTSFSITLLFSSCFHHYFTIKASEEWNYTKLSSYKQQGKVFVVHTQNGTYVLQNVVFADSAIKGKTGPYRSLSMRKNSVPYADIERTNESERYRKAQKDQVLSEVHIHVDHQAKFQDSLIITKENFIKVREYTNDKQATTMSYVIGFVVVASVVVAIAASAGQLIFPF